MHIQLRELVDLGVQGRRIPRSLKDLELDAAVLLQRSWDLQTKVICEGTILVAPNYGTCNLTYSVR